MDAVIYLITAALGFAVWKTRSIFLKISRLAGF